MVFRECLRYLYGNSTNHIRDLDGPINDIRKELNGLANPSYAVYANIYDAKQIIFKYLNNRISQNDAKTQLRDIASQIQMNRSLVSESASRTINAIRSKYGSITGMIIMSMSIGKLWSDFIHIITSISDLHMMLITNPLGPESMGIINFYINNPKSTKILEELFNNIKDIGSYFMILGRIAYEKNIPIIKYLFKLVVKDEEKKEPDEKIKGKTLIRIVKNIDPNPKSQAIQIIKEKYGMVVANSILDMGKALAFSAVNMCLPFLAFPTIIPI